MQLVERTWCARFYRKVIGSEAHPMKIVNARRRGVGIPCPGHRLLPAAHLLAGLLLALILGLPAYGQDFHGASIQKVPVGPSGLPLAHVGDPIMATIRVRNLDDFSDSITV